MEITREERIDDERCAEADRKYSEWRDKRDAVNLHCHPPGECPLDIAADVARQDKRHLRRQRRNELNAVSGFARGLVISVAICATVCVVALAIDGAFHHLHVWR